MNAFYKVIFNIFRGFVRFAFYASIISIIFFIKVLSYEPGKNKEITPRKARRIRAFSSLKLFYFENVPECINKFLGLENYKNHINTHLKNGLQLRNNRTDKQALCTLR